MTNSHNDIDDKLKSVTGENRATDGDNLTFIHAQFAYAKSKQGKQAKRNQTAYKRRWFKKGGD